MNATARAITATQTDAQPATILPMWQEAAAPAPSTAVDMGYMYIHKAAPMKGAEPAADGKCMFMLKCFPIPADATPGQVRDMKFTDEQAQYIPYYGHIAHKKGEAGIVVGYVDACKGDSGLGVAVEGMEGPVVTETRATLFPRPQVECNTSRPRFGNYEPVVADFKEEIATMAKIEAIRHPRKAEAPKRQLCI